MPVVKAKPTSPGRRFVVQVKTPELHKGAPYAPLLEKKSKSGGRNNKGRITTRHRGGGHKQHYRIIDFKRTKDGIPARVERLEYDPNRSSHIALMLYADGERRYIIAPKGVKVGDQLDFKGPILKIAYQPNKYDSIGMVCGGTGITPMLQVVDEILANPADKTRVSMVFGNQTESDMCARHSTDPKVVVLHTASRLPT